MSTDAEARRIRWRFEHAQIDFALYNPSGASHAPLADFVNALGEYRFVDYLEYLNAVLSIEDLNANAEKLWDRSLKFLRLPTQSMSRAFSDMEPGLLGAIGGRIEDGFSCAQAVREVLLIAGGVVPLGEAWKQDSPGDDREQRGLIGLFMAISQLLAVVGSKRGSYLPEANSDHANNEDPYGISSLNETPSHEAGYHPGLEERLERPAWWLDGAPSAAFWGAVVGAVAGFMAAGAGVETELMWLLAPVLVGLMWGGLWAVADMSPRDDEHMREDVWELLLRSALGGVGGGFALFCMSGPAWIPFLLIQFLGDNTPLDGPWPYITSAYIGAAASVIANAFYQHSLANR